MSGQLLALLDDLVGAKLDRNADHIGRARSTCSAALRQAIAVAFLVGNLVERHAESFVQELRETELYKIPGISETLDWTSALLAAGSLGMALIPRKTTRRVFPELTYEEGASKINLTYRF